MMNIQENVSHTPTYTKRVRMCVLDELVTNTILNRDTVRFYGMVFTFFQEKVNLRDVITIIKFRLNVMHNYRTA